MGMLVNIILLLVFGLLGILFVTFLRLLFADCDAVEIELRQVERWDSESLSLKPDQCGISQYGFALEGYVNE
jgi:hypothetical protein